MRRTVLLIVMAVLLALAGNAAAISPQPEEVKPGQHVCTVFVVHVVESENGVFQREAPSTLVFEASASKKDVLERITRYLNDKLSEWNVSGFRIECKFPK